VLTTATGREALEGLASVDTIYVADKHAFDSPTGLLSRQLGAVVPLLWRLRRRRYDQLLLLHHLTTPFGRIKYRLLAEQIGAKQTLGLDNAHGGFLDEAVPDDGFGARHEVDYALAVAALAGAGMPSDPRLEIAVDSAAEAPAAELLAGSHAATPATELLAGSQARAVTSGSDVARQGPLADPAMDPGSDAGTGPFIALHAGGGAYSLARRWPPEAFAAVGRALAERTGARLAILGSDVDREPSDELARLLHGQAINLVGRTTVKETAAALRRCELLVSNDSGVVHLAAAVGTPVVAVFGPSNDLAWGPYPPAEHRVVRVSLPCSPCFYRGKSLGRPEGCATRDCLQLVTPEMVIAAATELLDERAGGHAKPRRTRVRGKALASA